MAIKPLADLLQVNRRVGCLQLPVALVFSRCSLDATRSHSCQPRQNCSTGLCPRARSCLHRLVCARFHLHRFGSCLCCSLTLSFCRCPHALGLQRLHQAANNGRPPCRVSTDQQKLPSQQKHRPTTTLTFWDKTARRGMCALLAAAQTPCNVSPDTSKRQQRKQQKKLTGCRPR